MKVLLKNFLLATVLCTVLLECKRDTLQGPTVAKFTIDVDSANAGDTVRFINNSSNASNYEWGFGDAFYSKEENPIHVYDNIGTFTITLTAYGNDQTDQVSKILKVVTPINIFEGKGLKNVSLGDTWAHVHLIYYDPNTKYAIGNDTASQYFDILIYYVNEGIILDFASLDTYLDYEDFINAIYVISPYFGRTEKGLKIGDKMSGVISKYGTPVHISSTSDYLGYYYPNGIYFESDTPPFDNVEVIVIFEPLVGLNASKQTGKEKFLQTDRVQRCVKQISVVQFQNYQD